jgi:hydrogenase expression/formation protein HypC
MNLHKFGGIKRDVNITLIDSPKKGDFVLIHVRYAIHRISPQVAQETLGFDRFEYGGEYRS